MAAITEDTASGTGVDLDGLLNLCLRRWWIIALVTVAVFGGFASTVLAESRNYMRTIPLRLSTSIVNTEGVKALLQARADDKQMGMKVLGGGDGIIRLQFTTGNNDFDTVDQRIGQFLEEANQYLEPDWAQIAFRAQLLQSQLTSLRASIQVEPDAAARLVLAGEWLVTMQSLYQEKMKLEGRSDRPLTGFFVTDWRPKSRGWVDLFPGLAVAGLGTLILSGISIYLYEHSQAILGRKRKP